jgi:fructokinase
VREVVDPSLPQLICAIETGGTKTVCALGTSWGDIRDSEKLVVPTTTPGETITGVLDWMEEKRGASAIAAIGVASFGPIDFATQAISLSTPKVPWRGVSWPAAIRERFGDVRVSLDTDTNGAGIAESRWGASRGVQVSVYVTVGTGIGGALIVDGTPVHGLQHPEFGHMFVPRVAGDDFEGACLSHRNCLEGMASGIAIERRWGVEASLLPANHPAWDLESNYLALALANIIAICSPESIVVGGGVLSADGLIEKVRELTRRYLAGYFSSPELDEGMDHFVVPPSLGHNAGVIGAFALGLDALSRSEC